MDETGYITPELLCIILSRIPTKELFRLQHVCKYWRELCWDVQSELDFSFSLQAPLSMNDDVLIDVVRSKVRQPAITSLSLNYCRAITNKSLREIGSSLHNLRSLSLAWCDNITIDGLLCLTTLTRLESLKFRNCTLINTNGWQLTDKLTHLTSFTSKTVDDNFLTKLIQSCPDLKYLNLYGSKVTTIQALPKLTNLHYLNLSSSSVTASLTTLGQMTQLTELNLADIAPSRIITDVLTSLTNLVSLNLAGNSHLVNSAVGVLTKLVNLEYLNIEGAVNVDMGVIPYLDRFVHLKHLRRHGTKLPSSIEVQYFVKNSLMRK